MKQLLTVISCGLLIISGCKKDNIPGTYFGSASATLNGVAWETTKVRTAINQPCYNGALGIELMKFNAQGLLREVLNLSKVQGKIGQQKIYQANFQERCNDTLDATYYTITADGDVLQDAYIEITGNGNHITIDKYDPVSQKLSGTFAVSLILTRRQSPDAPDTLHFRDGKFFTKVLE